MRSNSSPVSTFDKILRAYGTGGFTYTDLMAQLQRLLAIGASPEEMLETLRRRERIEPFPEYAHVEVVRLLNAAIARDVAEAAANAELHDGDAAQEPSSGAGTQESAQASDNPARSAPTLALVRASAFPVAASNSSAVVDGTRKLEQQVARQLAEHEMLTRSFERLKEAESTASSRAAALAADLTALRAVLESEQTQRREAERALAQSVGNTDVLRLRGEEGARESKRHQIELKSLRDTLSAREAQLAARDAELAALRQEHAKASSLLERGAKAGAQLEANAQAAQARSSSLAAELATTRNALQSEQGKSRDLNKAVAETRAELRRAETLASDLKGQVVRLRAQLDGGKARFDALRGAASIAALTASSPAPALPAALETRDDMRMHEQAAADRGKRRNLRSGTRPLIAGFAIALLAIAAWFLGRPAQEPKHAAVTESVIPAPGASASDCPTCSSAELPADRPKQALPSAQNPAPLPPTPVSAASPSSAKTPAAAVKRDAAPCSVHADIESCYDAIRWKPNDPVLLVGLGDALVRAKRPQDAIRSYRRAAELAPGMGGLAAKISAAQALALKHPAPRPGG